MSGSAAATDDRKGVVRCCQYGDTEQLQLLLLKHAWAAATFIDDDGCSLLHWAAVNGRTLLIQQIVHSVPAGSVSTLVNTAGGALREIPLQWACRYPHLSEVVILLLQCGSDANYQNINGQSSLHIAVTCQDNIAIPYLLVAAGSANVDLLDNCGSSSLQMLLASPLRTRTLELQRLLVSLECDARMCCDGDSGSSILHDIFSGEIDLFDGKLDVESVCLLLSAKGSASLLFAKNKIGLSPYELAMSSRSYYRIKVFVDLYLFQRFPSPVYASALCTISVVIFGHTLGPYMGPVVFLFVFVVTDLFSQSTLHKVSSSRITYGCVWGLIIDILICYYLYIFEFTSTLVHYMIVVNAGAIFATLLATHSTRPRTLPRNSAQITDLHTAPDGRNHFSRRLTLCSSCLSNKQQASNHCSYCKACICVLDHHCNFVDNCIGRGNRRVFVLFTLSASVGTMLISVLSYRVQVEEHSPYNQAHLDKHGYIYMLLKQQNDVMSQQPLLVIMTLVSFGVSIWTFILFVQQIVLIMNETTTYAVIKGRYKKSFFHFLKDCRRSTSNLWLFFRYGTFCVSTSDDTHFKL